MSINPQVCSKPLGMISYCIIDENFETDSDSGDLMPATDEDSKVQRIQVMSTNEACEDELDRVSDQFNGMIRLTLPAPREEIKYQIFTIIKNFIGKDLTKFSLPIYLNEPLSLLQRMAEVAKFIHILTRAAKSEDPLLKLAYIGVWAATNFAGTRNRLFKPFNPLLGETYELIGSDFKIYGEQVSHHPPVGVVAVETEEFKVGQPNLLSLPLRVHRR